MLDKFVPFFFFHWASYEYIYMLKTRAMIVCDSVQRPIGTFIFLCHPALLLRLIERANMYNMLKFYFECIRKRAINSNLLALTYSSIIESIFDKWVITRRQSGTLDRATFDPSFRRKCCHVFCLFWTLKSRPICVFAYILPALKSTDSFEISHFGNSVDLD